MAYIPSREFFETHPRFKGLTLEEAQERYGAYLKDKCVRNPHLTLEAAQEQVMKELNYEFRRELNHEFRLQGSVTGRLSSPRIKPHVIKPRNPPKFPNIQDCIDKALQDLAEQSDNEARRTMLEGNWEVNPFENKHTGQSAGVDCSQPFTQAMLEKAIQELREAGVSHEIRRNRQGEILSVAEMVDLNQWQKARSSEAIASAEAAPEPESLYPDGHDDPMSAIRDMCK